MMARNAQDGRIEAIFLRPARRAAVLSVTEAVVREDGLVGDHAPAGKRALTLFQAEHLPVIAALLGRDEADPALMRRNIAVSGINLLALRKTCVRIGSVEVQISGPCPPCSRMEEAFGHGGYSAVRGHGGVYAEVLKGGRLALGAKVTPVS